MALFIETANNILPVFLIIFLGMFLNRFRFFSESTKDDIVRLVFYVGTPALLFHTIAKADLYRSFAPDLIVFLLCAIVLYVFLLIFLCKGIKEPAKKAAVIQIGFRSNFAIVGMPLAMNLMAEEGVLMTAIALSFVVILYNITAVTLLSYYSGKQRDFKTMLQNIAKNPLIIGTALGLLWSLLKLPLPAILDKSLATVGDIATSMGLLIIGATITVTGFRQNQGYIFTALFFRNLLAPALFLGGAILLGFRGDMLTVTAILSASPAAVNCFVMAKKMGADPDISAYGVSFSTLLSIASIFVSIYCLKLFGLV
ncbi:MAG: AEC family transporter [Clostridia bacterium]|nr:AEC family transporter [Clostridia bacterium]